MWFPFKTTKSWRIHTNLCTNSISLAVQQSSDLHELAVPLDGVVDHRGLHEEGVITVHRPRDPFLGWLHEHAGLTLVHEGPHPLVRRKLRFLCGDTKQTWSKILDRRNHVSTVIIRCVFVEHILRNPWDISLNNLDLKIQRIYSINCEKSSILKLKSTKAFGFNTIVPIACEFTFGIQLICNLCLEKISLALHEIINVITRCAMR